MYSDDEATDRITKGSVAFGRVRENVWDGSKWN